MVAIEPVSEAHADRARERQLHLTKPPGSLGRLEDIAVRLAAIQRREDPVSRDRCIFVFAADHGVTEEGVSAYPSRVTQQMLWNFASGGAAINALARVAEARVDVVDVGVGSGTRNFARERAMSRGELEAAMAKGAEKAHQASNEGVVLAGLGEMGIGNTTAASAVSAALTGATPAQVTGAGTGLDASGVRTKTDVVSRALELHELSSEEPLRILECIGGLEMAALTGFCLEAGARRMAILVDGFITTAAFAVAWKLQPLVKDYAFFSHLSCERGHRVLLDWMGGNPLLDLGLRLGEGTGSALAMPIIAAAVEAHNGMATFESAGVSGRT
ncbi:MAG TPA: nicotinate-nucleotide--dimethylbenzimidazole phosphoribosyltransferase [Vicinamibacteria bacterium]|nr:nicotinate-nucleotide--dimethylbenzimidazole phosphoribosyltransferase [Vicinamibacteria bacterium]